MKSLFYLFRKSTINYFKVLKRTPSKLIMLILYFAMFGFILFSASIPKKNTDISSPTIVIAIGTLLVIVVLMLSLISGIKKMGSSFLMSDVNLIFTSPLKPQTILLYGFIKQIKTSLLFGLFLIFQLPNLTTHFKLAPGGAFVILILFMLLQLVCSFTSMLVYSLVNKSEQVKQNTKYAFNAVSILFIVWSLVSIYGPKDKLFNNALSFFSGKSLDYIPIVGWFKIMLTQCFTGYNSSFLLFLSLIIIVIGVIITILYNLNLDFYEDVLSSSEKNETMSKIKTKQIDQKALGSSNAYKYKMKTRKIISNYKATYSKAILYRHLLEYRKTGFGMINMYTGLLVVITLGYSLFFPVKEIKFLLFLFAYLSVITSFTSKWTEDLSKHYIFMIPDIAEKKVFYATFASIIKYITDGTITFVLAGILLKSDPIESLLCILAYISFGFVLTYGGVVNMRLIGVLGSKLFSGLLMFISSILYVLPGIIGAAIISTQFTFLGQYAIYPSILIWNSLAAIALLVISKKILDNIENV